tara:strand:+ start:3095 stop:4381 length:1287 start_codon:yes stop_codon:yes gene_type:complete
MKFKINFLWKKFSDLSNSEIYAILRLRQKVFIVEQDCPYEDADNSDKLAFHLLGYKENDLVAYSRVFPPGIKYDSSSIGRIVVDKEYRNESLGKIVTEKSIDFLAKRFPKKEIVISAQYRLVNFYKKLGFKERGKIYLEDNIEHIQMFFLNERKNLFYMPLISKKILFIFLTFVFGSIVFFINQDSTDGSIATVDGVPVSISRLEAYKENIDKVRVGGLNQDDELKILESLINEELILKKALDSGVLTYDSEIRNTIIQKMIQSITSVDIEPDEEQLRSFYRENIHFFTATGKIKIANFSFDNNKNGSLLAFETINLLKENNITKAKELDQKKLPSLPMDLLSHEKIIQYIGPELFQKIKDLEEGDLSNPIEYNNFLNIFLILEKEKNIVFEYSSIKEEVKSRYIKEEKDKILLNYFLQLRNEYKVKF